MPSEDLHSRLKAALLIEDDDTSEEAQQALLKSLSWSELWPEIRALLLGPESRYWYPATVLVHQASEDMDFGPTSDSVIAVLYHRLRGDPTLGLDGSDEDSTDNLVWSITRRLKGLDYLSEWEPELDPGVAVALRALSLGEQP